jgi:hypothetical protein
MIVCVPPNQTGSAGWSEGHNNSTTDEKKYVTAALAVAMGLFIPAAPADHCHGAKHDHQRIATGCRFTGLGWDRSSSTRGGLRTVMDVHAASAARGVGEGACLPRP